MPDMALCKNEECPARKHCYRFTAESDCHQVYARFSVPPKRTRCEYYIPSKTQLDLPFTG